MKRLIAAGLIGLLTGCSVPAKPNYDFVKPKRHITKEEIITNLIRNSSATETSSDLETSAHYLGLGFEGKIKAEEDPTVCGKPMPPIEEGILGLATYTDRRSNGWGQGDVIGLVVEYEDLTVAYRFIHAGHGKVIPAITATRVCATGRPPGIEEHLEKVKDLAIGILRLIPVKERKVLDERVIDDGSLGLMLDRV